MTGWGILKHSFGMIERNFSAAMRISLVLMIISLAVQIGLTFWVTVNAVELMQSNSMVFFVVQQLPALLSLVFGAWMAVAWHRFILLNERPASWMPAFHGNNILMYVLWIIVLMVIYILLLLPIIALVIALVQPSMDAGANPSAGAILLSGILIPLVFLLAVVVMTRLSPVLVSRALGEKLGLRQAWRLTQGSSKPILAMFGIGLIFMFAFMVVMMIFVTLASGSTMLMIVAVAPMYLILTWLSGMLSVSVMTTIYGVYVEKREL